MMHRVEIDCNKCKGCGLCINNCPLGHLEFSPDLNAKGLSYAREKSGTNCSGCGICYLVCPDCCIVVYEENQTKQKK